MPVTVHNNVWVLFEGLQEDQGKKVKPCKNSEWTELPSSVVLSYY